MDDTLTLGDIERLLSTTKKKGREAKKTWYDGYDWHGGKVPSCSGHFEGKAGTSRHYIRPISVVAYKI